MLASLFCAQLRAATNENAAAAAATSTSDSVGRYGTRLLPVLLGVEDDHPAEHLRRVRHRVAGEVAIHAAARRPVDDDATASVAGALIGNRVGVRANRVVTGVLASAVAGQTVAVEDRLDVLDVRERLHADCGWAEWESGIAGVGGALPLHARPRIRRGRQ